MSTYPGDDPQAGQQPADPAEPATPDAPADTGTEPTQPVGYWERQAAEQAAQRAREQGQPYPTTPYPQGGGPETHPVFNPTSSQPSSSYGQNPYGAPPPLGQQPPYAGQPPYPGQPGYPAPGQQAPYSPTPPPAWQPGWQGAPGQPPYSAFAAPRPDHPQSTLALVLGLVGLIGAFIFCGVPLVVSPFAWALGRNAVKEIAASQGRLGGESQARTGMILGIIGTVLLILSIIALIGFIALAAVSEPSTTGSSV